MIPGKMINVWRIWRIRVVDENGEPRIVNIDNEAEIQVTFAAKNLVEFIKIVLAESEMTTRGEVPD